MNRTTCRVFLAGLLLSISSACFAGRFSAGSQADIGYFTDATVSMMKDVNFGFTRGAALYVKGFMVMEEPEEAALMKASGDADKVLRGIVRYSLRLVAITESGKSETDQIKQYADYLAELQGPIQTALELEPGYYDELISDVRKQKEFLKALQTAQPIMNGMGRFMDKNLDNVDATAAALARKLNQKIDIRYAEVIAYQNALDREKYDVLRALANVYRSVRKDDAAYKELMRSQQIRDPKLIPEGKPTYDQLIAMSKHLMAKFDVMHQIQAEIEPDWNTYRESHRELQKLENQIHQEAKQFRLIAMTWVRAHQKMASGKTKPAEWFDFNDAAFKGLKAGIDLVL